MTVIIKVNPNNPEEDKIEISAEIIKKGGIVAFPTETVYGLGADGLNRDAVKKIFVAKNRPMDNPLILHVSDMDMIHRVAQVNKTAKKLIDEFFPGPLTLIMRRKKIVPDEVTAGLDTVAVRMPSNKIALKLIELSETPISAPSANVAGKPSPTKVEHVIEDLWEKIDCIIDGGETEIGVESTVVDTTTYPVEVIRPGGLEVEKLKEIVDIRFFSGEENIPKSPGMKYRHYAPDAQLQVIYGRKDEVVRKINELYKCYREKGMRVGLAVTDRGSYNAEIIEEIGKTPQEVAKNLFDVLRKLDKKADLIIAEGIEERGLGLAVMNRLKKASNYQVLRV